MAVSLAAALRFTPFKVYLYLLLGVGKSLTVSNWRLEKTILERAHTDFMYGHNVGGHFALSM